MKTFIPTLCFLCAVCIIKAQPESYDIEIGQAYRAQIESQIGLYDDPALAQWVSSIGERLVAELGEQPFDYSFEILDSDASNAFALPGGPTYVTRGLLSMVNSESELAGVMAHEIIHVHRRHAIQQMNGSGFLKDLFRLPGQVVGIFNSSLGSLLQLPVDLGSAAFDANYSRQHEKEADRLGIQLAAAAGYDPYALADMLTSLGKETIYLTGRKEKRSLTNDHPITQKRLKYLAKDLEKSFGERSGISGDDIRILDGMIFGANPGQGVFSGNEFMQPDIMLHWTVPQDWEALNSPATVGAMEQNGEGFVMISLADQSMSPQGYADTVAAMFKSRPDLIHSNKPVEIGGYPGYSVVLKAMANGQPLYLRLVWIEFGDLLLELAAYGIEVHAREMNLSLESMRDLTEQERGTITVRQIAAITAESGESIESISERTGNVLSKELTALINGLEQSHSFEAGEVVKVVQESVY